MSESTKKARCLVCAGSSDIPPYTEHKRSVKRISASNYRGQPLRYTTECWRCVECQSHEFCDPNQSQAMAFNMVIAKDAIDSMFELRVVK